MPKRGEGIRQQGKTWWLDFKHEGKRHYVKLGYGLTRYQALELAQSKRFRILRGEEGIGKKAKDITFEKACGVFIRYAKTNLRQHTVTFYEQCIRQLEKAFAGWMLSKITPFSIEGYKTRRAREGVVVRTNKEITTLKGIFNRTIKLKLYEGTNPAVGIKKLEERDPEDNVRFLEYDEEDRLVAAAREPLRTIILTGIYVGTRTQAEGLTLRWSAVDLGRKYLTIASNYSKNARTRRVPMNSILVEAFTKLKAAAEHTGPDDHVFLNRNGKPYRSIRTAFTTAARRAGLPGLTPHVMRHTFASRLAMKGYSTRAIMELGGWQQISMVKRYAHLSPKHLENAVEDIARRDLGSVPQKIAVKKADSQK